MQVVGVVIVVAVTLLKAQMIINHYSQRPVRPTLLGRLRASA